MSSSTGTTSSASIYTTPAFWERLWRTAGIQSVLCFIFGTSSTAIIRRSAHRPTHWQPSTTAIACGF